MLEVRKRCPLDSPSHQQIRSCFLSGGEEMALDRDLANIQFIKTFDYRFISEGFWRFATSSIQSPPWIVGDGKKRTEPGASPKVS
jgi:hypothetical protein